MTFEAMKRVLSESPEVKREAEAERQKQLSEAFRNTSFHELVTISTIKVRKIVIHIYLDWLSSNLYTWHTAYKFLLLFFVSEFVNLGLGLGYIQITKLYNINCYKSTEKPFSDGCYFEIFPTLLGSYITEIVKQLMSQILDFLELLALINKIDYMLNPQTAVC